MSIPHTLCPKCETKMVRANGKFGPYWRCPRWGCEGTRDSMGRDKKEREEWDKEKKDYEADYE